MSNSTISTSEPSLNRLSTKSGEGQFRAFGQAARRAREAGCDGVQIHGAHGYLISQFLTPATNTRQDRWGGSAEKRLTFLREVAAEIRRQVGEDYPVWIKLGVAGSNKYGLDIEMGAQVARACTTYGIDCFEISYAAAKPEDLDKEREAPFLPMAQAVREAVGPDFLLALVEGFRTRKVMEEVLASEVVQIISMSRPLLAEPDLPNKLRAEATDEAECTSCDLCLEAGAGPGCAVL